jgi:hypothetical protein
MEKLIQTFKIETEENKFQIAALTDLIKCGWVIDTWNTESRRGKFFTVIELSKNYECE